MAKILFVANCFDKDMFEANGINILNVIRELEKSGNEIICAVHNSIFGDVYEFGNTKVYAANNIQKIPLWLHRTIAAINLWRYPCCEPGTSRNMLNLCVKLHKQYHFDCVLGVFRMYENVDVAIKLKRRFPDLLCGAYCLDMLRAYTPFGITKEFHEKLCVRADLNMLRNVDFALLPIYGKGVYDLPVYRSYQDKIHYMDFPLFVLRDRSSAWKRKLSPSDTLDFVFAGTLDLAYRNPEPLLKCFIQIRQHYPSATLHFYSRGNCDSLISEYQNITDGIQSHGMVPHDQLLDILDDTNFLVNIENKNMENIVPSKIFELFSTGKPIINFTVKNSSVTQYFARYPLCFDIENDQENAIISDLLAFIGTNHHSSCEPRELSRYFIMNTPQFTADLIMRQLNS